MQTYYLNFRTPFKIEHRKDLIFALLYFIFRYCAFINSQYLCDPVKSYKSNFVHLYWFLKYIIALALNTKNLCISRQNHELPDSHIFYSLVRQFRTDRALAVPNIR